MLPIAVAGLEIVCCLPALLFPSAALPSADELVPRRVGGVGGVAAGVARDGRVAIAVLTQEGRVQSAGSLSTRNCSRNSSKLSARWIGPSTSVCVVAHK